MVYMFEVYALISAAVFGLAGTVMLILFAVNRANEYGKARRTLREIVANSRNGSRVHDIQSSRCA